MAVATRTVTDICVAAKAAARALAQLDSATKDRALLAVADALEARTPEILEANARDLEAGREAGLSAALMDRLALDERRVAAMAKGVRDIVALPDPVGEVVDGSRFANGLQMRKVRVPLGVVAVVYEARPNVTIDAAALALKSGNAIVLRGSSSATHSNAVLAGVARDGGRGARAAGGRARARGRRRARGAGRARRAGGRGRPDDPARRRGAQARAPGRGQGPGHLRRVRQLPRLRRRERRPRGRAGDRPQRQDAAAGRVQRGRDAARARRRRGGVPAGRAARAARRGRRAARRRADARPRGRRAGGRRDRGRLRRGVPRAHPRRAGGGLRRRRRSST